MSPETVAQETGRRPAIAVMTSSFPSHLFSTFGVARRLHQAGFEVEYWGDESIRRLVLRHRFEHYTVEGVWPCYEALFPEGIRTTLLDRDALLAKVKSLRQKYRELPVALDRFEASLDAQLARRTPRLVLLDPFAAAHYPLLKKRGLKCVLLQDKPVPFEDGQVPPPTTGHIPRPTQGGRTMMKMLWRLEDARTELHRRLRTCLGRARLYTHNQLLEAILARAQPTTCRPHRRVHYDLCFEGLDEWVLGVPDLDFSPVGTLPPGIRYIGHWVDHARPEVTWPAGQRPAGGRVVYVTMGATVTHWALDLSVLQRILTALSGIDDLAVFVSTGNHKGAALLRSQFPQCCVASFLPQLSLLRSATLAVTHGGANSLRECVATETPMLVFPRGYDQRGNAARIVRHGIGLWGSRRYRPEQIRGIVELLLRDSGFQARVAQLNVTCRQRSEALLGSALEAALGSALHPPQDVTCDGALRATATS